MDTETPLETSDATVPEPAKLTDATPLGSSRPIGLMDYDEFAAQQQAQAQRNKVLLRTGVVICALAIPFAYLWLTGRFSTAQFTDKNLATKASVRSVSAVPATTPANPTLGSLGPGEQSPADPVVAKDLHDYLFNGIERIAPEEALALKAYQSVTGSDFHNNATSFATMRKTVVPQYSAFVQDAAKLKPKTPEVKAIQALFLTSVQLRLLAYKHILSGEGAKDDSWRLTVGAEFQAADTAVHNFQNATRILAQRNGVQLPN